MSSRTRSPANLFQILPPEEQKAVLDLGIAFRKVGWEERLRRAEVRIRDLEAKYGCTLAQLESQGLPPDASPSLHEDYVEWHYWERVRTEAGQMLARFQEIAQIAETE
ncbi:MAG: hypothetical protein ACP5OO_04260 [Chloroflexia bacterium]